MDDLLRLACSRSDIKLFVDNIMGLFGSLGIIYSPHMHDFEP